MALISDGRSAAPPAADPARPLGEPPLGERPLAIGVLGGLSLAVDGAPLALANRKARGILAYLALEGAAPCSRERLAGLFWSDVGEKQARNSLRQAIFELREALEPRGCGALLVGRDHLALAPGRVLLDIDDMLARIALGEVPETLLSRAAGAMPMLSAYEDLSPLFAEWLRCARQLTQDRLERALERGFADPATPRPGRRLLAEAALRLNPVHEEACRIIMRLAAEDGEIGAALRCYAGLYEVLGAEHDMEPSAPTQQLVAAIKRGHVAPPRPAVPATAAAPVSPAAARARLGRVGLAPEDTPVLAVLPFRAVGPEPQPEYLAEGIVGDIVSLLAGLREPAVISANSTRRFRGTEAEDLARIGELLGADYVVTGSIRLHGGSARIAVELAEASQGAVLWGRTIEVPKAALFEAQAEIAAGIANALVPRLKEAELRASRRRPPEDLGAYHLLLRARDRMFQLAPAPFEAAGPLLAQAVALDPDYAPIYAAMIEWRCLRIFQGWSPDRDADSQALEAAAVTALRLDPCHSRALALYGHNRAIIGRHFEEALDLLDRAVAAGPNDAETLSWTSPTLAYVGRAPEAVARAARAIALSPQDPFLYRYEHFLSIAHYAGGDLEAAAQLGLRAASRHPNYTSNLRITVAALGGLGRRRDAAPLVARLMALQPGLRVGTSLPRYAFRDAAQRERHARNLRLAGVPG